MNKNTPLYIGVIILALELVLAWRLHLPEGWPRFAAVGVVVLTGVLLVLVARKSLNEKAGR